MSELQEKEMPWHPVGSHSDITRQELAKYLNRVGRGVNCRLDVPVLVMEDVKWASKIFSELSKELSDLAFNDARPEIWRVLGARYAMENAKRELHVRNERKVAKKVFREAVIKQKR